jgi:hypothetical protein
LRRAQAARGRAGRGCLARLPGEAAWRGACELCWRGREEAAGLTGDVHVGLLQREAQGAPALRSGAFQPPLQGRAGQQHLQRIGWLGVSQCRLSWWARLDPAGRIELACRAELKKQVLPRLVSPTTRMEGSATSLLLPGADRTAGVACARTASSKFC